MCQQQKWLDQVLTAEGCLAQISEALTRCPTPRCLRGVPEIRRDTEGYHSALRDWVARDADSRFALSPDEVIARSRPRDADKAWGHAHFQLASQLEIEGHHAAAVLHYREAHRLVPDSWTFRRKAWSLEKVGSDAIASFWQGPDPESSEA